ncbi:Ribose-5-phosphate isomerase A [compost metagenome]
MLNGSEFITDNGNLIADCNFQEIVGPVDLHQQINLIPGVVESGLFNHMATAVIVGYKNGEVEMRGRQS